MINSLGVHIDSNHSWSERIYKISKKVSLAIDYCCSVWDELEDTLTTKITEITEPSSLGHYGVKL